MLATLRMQGRYERKLQRIAGAVEARRRFVAAGLALGYRFDENAGENGYELCSLYFDTPELDALQANADGDYVHVKFRVRAYAGGDRVFYEIKYKRGDLIYKVRRALVAGPLSPELCRREFRSLLLESGADALVARSSLAAVERLAPVVLVRYRRTALVGFPEERVCLDQEIAFGPPRLDPAAWFGVLAPADPRLQVYELKTPPGAVSRALLAMGRLAGNQTSRFSKYCEAVTWLHDDPAAYGANPDVGLRWRPVVPAAPLTAAPRAAPDSR